MCQHGFSDWGRNRHIGTGNNRYNCSSDDHYGSPNNHYGSPDDY